jgi:hypothetical protein
MVKTLQYNPDYQSSNASDKLTSTPSIDSLLSKLQTEQHGAIIENTKAQLQAFNYVRVPKRYIPYQVDANSLDSRFPESFRHTMAE